MWSEIIVWLFWILWIVSCVPLLVGLFMLSGPLLLRINQCICRNKTFAEEITISFMRNLWLVFAKIWYGYEIRGLENLLQSSPAVLISYHGALPVDIYSFLAYFLIKNIPLHLVSERFLFNLPGGKFFGINEFLELCNCLPSSLEECIEHLKRNENVFIYPGGIYEAHYSDSNYKLLWKNRNGFAKVALEAKAPIIPVFTRNIRAAYHAFPLRSILSPNHNKTRIPFVPTIGGLPVKLVTYIGKPIPYDETLSPEQLRDKAAEALEQLIAEHQEVPGSIFKALWERFSYKD